MNLRNSAVLTAITLALALPAMSTAATIVANGSFEEGTEGLTTPSWTTYETLPGWTIYSPHGLEIQTAGTLGLTPSDGDHYAELDGYENSLIVQFITLASGWYTGSFDYSPRIDGITDTNDILVGILELGAFFISGPDGVNTVVGEWTTFSQTFFADAGTYTLFFAGAGTEDSLGGLIDNIQIVPAAVPVPAAGFMLFGALGGLAALRRRRATA